MFQWVSVDIGGSTMHCPRLTVGERGRVMGGEVGGYGGSGGSTMHCPRLAVVV